MASNALLTSLPTHEVLRSLAAEVMPSGKEVSSTQRVDTMRNPLAVREVTLDRDDLRCQVIAQVWIETPTTRATGTIEVRLDVTSQAAALTNTPSRFLFIFNAFGHDAVSAVSKLRADLQRVRWMNGDRTPMDTFVALKRRADAVSSELTAAASGTIANFSWAPSTRAKYEDRLGAVPPAARGAGMFLMGEAMDGRGPGGASRYQVHRENGKVYEVGSRNVTIEEFNILVSRGGRV